MTCARRLAGARRPAPSTSAESPRRPEPRPGRARARLSLLPALALLLGALSLFAAAPVQAQTTVWSGTLTAKTVLFGAAFGCDNEDLGSECSTSTVLTEDEFTYDGQPYTITAAFLDSAGPPRQLNIGFSASAASLVAAGLTLKVGSNEYELSDAGNVNTMTLRWKNSGLNFQLDDTVSLSLIDKERLTGLKVNYGDQELYIGPYGRLGEADGRVRNVQASPTMKSVTLTPTWGSANISSVSAQVYYYMPGEEGPLKSWAADQSGESGTLSLYSSLGTPGYPRVTLTAADSSNTVLHEYTIIFQNNGRWKFHNNNLLKRLGLTVPQGQ